MDERHPKWRELALLQQQHYLRQSKFWQSSAALDPDGIAPFARCGASFADKCVLDWHDVALQEIRGHQRQSTFWQKQLVWFLSFLLCVFALLTVAARREESSS
jgi:hypothetical protein